MSGLPALAGTHLGHTDWQAMTQERVNLFADATDDHQYIHVDPERAKAGPFGRTVAHGYLTLSLLASITGQLLRISDAGTMVNYGLDRVRLPAPLPVGERYRGGAEVLEVSEIPGGFQLKVRATIEVQGAEKPSLVAECLFRAYA
jgi:acyl dehydratase